MTASATKTRLPNRALTDDVMQAVLLFEQPCRGARIVRLDDAADLLDWSRAKVDGEVRYLRHSYGAFRPWGVSGDFVEIVEAGVARYDAGDRTVCPCCAGESER